MNETEKAISLFVDAVVNLTDSINELKNQMVLLRENIEEAKKEVEGA